MLGNSGFITVETAMVFGLGFFLAMLMMLAFLPAVHQRAVRLTRRKYDPVPLSEKEMHAEKDRLRADFAMSTHKLERSIEEMQRKAAAQSTEMTRKADTIAQLKHTLDTRDGLIAQLQAQAARFAANPPLDAELRALKIDNANKTAALQQANRRIETLMAEIDALTAALDRRIHVYDTQQHEIMALTNQSDALRIELASLARPARKPAPSPVPDTARIQHRVVASDGGEHDVIRRALEAIEANSLGNGYAMPQIMPHGWIDGPSAPSNGSVPFGH